MEPIPWKGKGHGNCLTGFSQRSFGHDPARHCTSSGDTLCQKRQSCPIDKATGSKKVPKCPGEILLIGFLGFQRDHVVLELLETKNDRNLGYF